MKTAFHTTGAGPILTMVAGAALLGLKTHATQFKDVTQAGGLTRSTAYCSAAAWGDYNNDGFPDLFIAAGGGASHPNFLYRNAGNGTFTRIPDGPLAQSTDRSVVATWADPDNDGALDLFVTPPYWLSAEIWQMRRVTVASTTQELVPHFGLGDASNADVVRIEWPSGMVQDLTDVAANQILTIWEPPALKAAMQADGACVLNIRAEPNQGWQIQASSDLVTWETIVTVTPTTVGFQHVDPAVPGMTRRFYRMLGEQGGAELVPAGPRPPGPAAVHSPRARPRRAGRRVPLVSSQALHSHRRATERETCVGQAND